MMKASHSLPKTLAITSMIVFTTGIVILWQYLIEKNPFMSQGVLSDLLRANLPTYIMFYDEFTQGFSFWNWSMGIGTSIFSHADTIFDPFMYITFIGGRDGIAYMMGWSFLAKLVCGALAMVALLSYYKLDDKAIIIASTMYAFCGYSMIMGSNLALGTILVYAPLAILALEYAIARTKYLPLIVILSIIALTSYYYLYSIGIILFIFLLFRHHTFDKKLLTCILILLMCGMIAILISSPLLLPQLDIIKTLPRTGSGSDITLSLSLIIPDIRTLFSCVARGFEISILGTRENGFFGYLNNGNIGDYFQNECFIGCLAFPIIILYLIKNKEKRKPILYIMTFVGILISLPIVAVIFNAFSTINYRWLYIVHILLAILVAISLTYLFKNPPSPRETLQSIFLSMAILMLSVCVVVIHNDLGLTEAIVRNKYSYITIIICYIALMLTAYYDKISISAKTKKQLAATTLVVITCFSSVVCYQGWYGSESSISHFDDSTYGYNDPSSEVIKDIQGEDLGFYRIHKDFDSVYDNDNIPSNNDAMAQKYYGLKNYNSMINSNYVTFLQTLGVYVACIPDIKALREAGIDPIDIKGAQLNYINGVDDKYELYDYLGVKYYLSKHESGNPIPPQFTYMYTQKGIDVYVNGMCNNLAYSNSDYIHQSDFLTKSFDDRVNCLQSYTVLNDSSHLPYMGSLQIEHFSFEEENIELSVSVTNGPQYLCLSIPYDKDWSIYVDGTKIESEMVNIALLGALIPEGNHEIVVKYTPNSFNLGLKISFGVIILVVLTSFLPKIVIKMKKKS